MSQIARLLCALFSLTLVSGCLQKKKPATRASVKKAVADRNWTFVRDVCDKKVKAEYFAKKDACKRIKIHDQLNKALQAKCEDIEQVHERARTSGSDYPREGELSAFQFMSAVAERIAECKRFTYLFEHVTSYTKGRITYPGKSLLLHVGRRGHDVEGAWSTYLESHRGETFFAGPKNKPGMRALGNIVEWLVHKKITKHCPTMLVAVEGTAEWKQYVVLRYARMTKCKAGIPLAVKLAKSRNKLSHKEACRALKELGSAELATSNGC